MVYVPGKLPPLETEDGQALAGFLEDELQRISSSTLDDILALELRPSHAAALRPRAGMLICVDGSDYNPRTLGEGIYTYNAAGAFVKLQENPFQVKTAAPGSPATGMVAYADGSSWNPNDGEGLYVYGSDGAWHALEPPVWVAYTPTVTAAAGTLTTVSATGRYARFGKIVFVQVNALITTNGTGSGSINITLPITAGASNFNILNGRENAVNVKQLHGGIGASATVMNVRNYDGTYPGLNLARLIVSGPYEID